MRVRGAVRGFVRAYAFRVYDSCNVISVNSVLFIVFSSLHFASLFDSLCLVSLVVAGFLAPRFKFVAENSPMRFVRRSFSVTIVLCDIVFAHNVQCFSLYFSLVSLSPSVPPPSILSLSCSLHLRNEITLFLHSASLRPGTQRVTVLPSVDDYALSRSLFLSLSFALTCGCICVRVQ